MGTEDGQSIDATWTSADALLYALSVGAGQENPLEDLAFTTENSGGIAQRVLPTFGAVVIFRASQLFQAGGGDRTHALHERQTLTLERPLPVDGCVRITTRMCHGGSGSAGTRVTYDSTIIDLATGHVLVTTESAWVFIGSTDKSGAVVRPVPNGVHCGLTPPPDLNVLVPTRPEQALLYRLCGDRNPLHSDPLFARQYGFSRPPLHGMCTYGIVGRVLLKELCDGDPARFQSMSVRFRRPVSSGDTLRVLGWRDDDACRFRVLDSAGAIVVDQGVFRTRPVERLIRPETEHNR